MLQIETKIPIYKKIGVSLKQTGTMEFRNAVSEYLGVEGSFTFEPSTVVKIGEEEFVVNANDLFEAAYRMVNT